MTSKRGSAMRGRGRAILLGAMVLVTPTASGAPATDSLDPLLGEAEVAYPDLVPNVDTVDVWQTMVFNQETQAWDPGPVEVSFDTWSQNIGEVPLELTADDPGNPSTTVSQCVAWTATRLCRDRRQVGGFTWHDPHTHFHYMDFATYELRTFRRSGRVDWSDAGLVAVSEKVSFCIQDTTQVDQNAQPAPYYVSCTPARQGISPGWADIYGPTVPGQLFLIPNMSDGTYALVVTLDAADRLYEADRGNNRVVLTLDVSVSTETATIVGRSWPSGKK